MLLVATQLEITEFREKSGRIFFNEKVREKLEEKRNSFVTENFYITMFYFYILSQDKTKS